MSNIPDTIHKIIDTASTHSVTLTTLQENLKTEANSFATFMDVAKVLSGGLFGALLTYCVTKYNNRVQKMYCYYTDDDIRSKIPVQTAAGMHQNYHFKEFKLINNTNKDIPEFKIIFEFDAQSTITHILSQCKEGKNVVKQKYLKAKANEVTFTVKHFNRKDKITFEFEIADITDNHYNITEAGVNGIKIYVKDKRKAKKPTQIKVVDKSQIQKVA